MSRGGRAIPPYQLLQCHTNLEEQIKAPKNVTDYSVQCSSNN